MHRPARDIKIIVILQKCALQYAYHVGLLLSFRSVPGRLARQRVMCPFFSQKECGTCMLVTVYEFQFLDIF